MYIPFRGNELGAADAPLSHSKERNLLLEGGRCGTKSRLTRKGVYLMYIPFRGNELGAADAPLSQQITRFPSQNHLYDPSHEFQWL